MGFSRTFGFKILCGFGLLVTAIIVDTIVTHNAVARLQDTQQEVNAVLHPTIGALSDFRSLIHQAKDDLESWERSGRDPDSSIPDDVRSLLLTETPESHRQVSALSPAWDQRQRETYENLHRFFADSLLSQISGFTSNLSRHAEADSFFAPPGLPDLLNSFQFAEARLLDLIREFEGKAGAADRLIQSNYKRSGNLILINGIFIAAAAILIAIFLFYSIYAPVRKYRNIIASMGQGILPEETIREGPDELGRIGSALNNLIQGLKNLSTFAREMGKGNFKSDFKPLSEDDTLGNSLIQLRENLKTAAIEEEKRKREDERRNWSNQGIARFSEILREHSGDLDKLSSRLISELVKYLGAKVGGLFLIRSGAQGEKEIYLVASYAYDRIKHLKKTIQVGEGLVGRCVQEGNTIFLTDIPEDYIRIKSGLGEDNPRCLLIVPLHFNEEITGVIELATLEIFEDFQIDFIERIGASIASSISAAFTSRPIKPDTQTSNN